ncbi:MAG: helix-turn-helix domain-containing protein [Pseudonocardiaceae bacterium]
MHPFGELSSQRRRLGEALRTLRSQAGLTGERLAERLDVSQSRISRVELGQQAASADLVQRWAEVTTAPEDRGAELVEWAEAASTEAVAWRAAMGRGLARLQQDARETELGAETICSFQPVIVPGLVQVPEYARRVFAAGNPTYGPAEIAAAVAARMDRQLVLYEETTRVEFVIAEAALRWRIGPPKVMIAQLDRITALAGLETVTVGLIPLDAQVDTWHEHGFNLVDGRAEDDPVVHIETQTSQVTTTDPAEVAFYRQAFARLRQAAVHGPEAEELLRQIREGLLRTQSQG